jgi:hyperosmotically inducible protein
MSQRLSLQILAMAAGLMLMTDFSRAEGGTTGSPVENTERNVRDKGDVTLTPADQHQDESDINITANIRKAITDNESLSVNAHNIKIITQDGVVTLRGPVDSEAEKTTLHSLAHKTPGVTQVDNQLEVKTP